MGTELLRNGVEVFRARCRRIAGPTRQRADTSIPSTAPIRFRGYDSLSPRLAVAHQLGHCLHGGERPAGQPTGAPCQHAETTADYTVYYGEGRDAYDVRGRTAHESIFNVKDGNYRCPNSQQGYSPFTTWTRGLAWIMVGYAGAVGIPRHP